MTPRAAGKLAAHPTKYRDDFVRQVRYLCALGAIDNDLAEFFGCSRAVLNDWKKRHPAFGAAIAEAKTLCDQQVERRLYERACGYSHPAVKIFYDSKSGDVVRAEYVERYPPDTTACIFWLKNRRPAHWRDRQDVNVTGDLGARIVERLVAGRKRATTVR